MALPPIITNSPLFKVLNGPSKPANETQQPAPEKSSGQQDTVSLSEAALRKIEDVQATRINSPQTARAAAEEVRNDLAANPDTTLGLDPDSSL